MLKIVGNSFNLLLLLLLLPDFIFLHNFKQLVGYTCLGTLGWVNYGQILINENVLVRKINYDETLLVPALFISLSLSIENTHQGYLCNCTPSNDTKK